MPHTLFSIEEVAEYLHLLPSDIKQLVQDEAIPYIRQGAGVVFRRREVDGWATRRLLKLDEPGLKHYHRTTSAKMHDLSQRHAVIPELIALSHVDADMTSRTMPSLIRDITMLAELTGKVVYPDDLRDSIIEREKLGTTAMAGGFALLHPLHHEPYMFDDSFIIVGRAVQPVPFHAPDGRTTDIFFLVCCQDDRIHLHVLARLCMMCQQTPLILNLRTAADDEEMLSDLYAAEEEVIRTL